jgi:CBS domain-containing protein
MKVKSVMTTDVQACRPEDSLSVAALIMWNRDCGVVPVVDHEGRVAGVITDRDICMAAATNGRLASDIRVGETISGAVYFVAPEESVQNAIDLMRERKVRRVPVVDGEGKLVGILSVGDIARHSDKGKSKKHVSNRETMKLVKSISEPWPIVLKEQQEQLLQASTPGAMIETTPDAAAT